MTPFLGGWRRLQRTCGVIGFLLLGAGGMTLRAAETSPGFFHPEAGLPLLRTYHPAEYGGHYQVWSMLQRRDGVRFFGYFGGLAEFDGAAWKNLLLNSGAVRGFAETADGKIYFTSTTKLGWLDHDPAGELRFHSITEQLPTEAGAPGIFAELAVHEGALLISTTKGVVRWRDGRAEKFWPIPGTSTMRLNQIGDRIWARRMGAAAVYELRDDDWHVVVNDSWLDGKRVNFIAAAGDGRAIFGIHALGLFTPGADGKLAPWRTPAETILAQAQLYTAITLADGTLAVATGSDGLVLISPDGARARQITVDHGLPSNLVQNIGTDRTGRVWACTMHGMATFDWPAAFTLFDHRLGFDPTAIRSMRRVEEQVVLGGTGGVFTVQGTKTSATGPAQIVRLSAGADFHADPVVHSTGRIYPSTEGFKMVREGRTEQVLKVNDMFFSLRADPANADRIFFGAQKGVGSALYRDGAWQLEGYAENFSLPIAALEVSPDGTLWARTTSGIGWRVRAPRTAEGAPDWPRAETVAMEKIPGWPLQDEPFWVITNTPVGLTAFTPQGVLTYDFAQERFEPAARYDRSITPVGQLFAVSDETTDGLWCIVFPEGRVAGRRHAMGRYVFADGAAKWIPLPEEIPQALGPLAAHEVIPDAIHPHVYWMRGIGAVARLDLSQMQSAAPPASAPLLRRVTRGGTPHPLPVAGAPLQLAWERSALTFQFAAPRPELGLPRFETRLLGWNESWSEPSPRPDVSFNGLGAGDYVFEVRERDAQSRVGPVLRVAFAIMPPWWTTPWAYAAYALLGIGVVAVYIRLRLAAARREQARLEQLVAQRTVELADARDEAQAASNAKSTFLAHMSHELRTPLNGIIGYAQVLLKDRDVAGPQRERVNIVHGSGQHLLRMINEVLDFSKIEAGKIERHDAPLHLPQLLRELALAHEAAAQGRGLRFAVEADGELPEYVSGDAQKLRQVLDNLLSNAVKFTKSGGVTLRVARDDEKFRAGSPNPTGIEDGAALRKMAGSGDPALHQTHDRARPASAAPFGAADLRPSEGSIRFEVIDTGVGMNADDRARLFQPFEQARDGRPAEPGTGLGLAISQRLVRLLGGDLQVESEPGRGSRFWFALPLPATQAPHSGSRSPFPLSGYEGARRRILVVDDNAVNRSLLNDLLTPLGFDVVEFPSAEEMLAVPPAQLAGDLAFLDVKMPGIDGLELARRLRARPDTRALPLVFTSASVLTFDRAAAEAVGAPNFLPKPFAETELHALLQQLLPVRWQFTTPSPAVPANPSAAALSLPRPLIDELLLHAESGDIAALRHALAAALHTHPGHMLLSQVESAANSYQLERVRQLLRGAAAAG